MYTLYGATGAGSVAPQALLAHLKVPFELKLVDFARNEHRSAQFLAINPRGQIPVLVSGDSSVLTESMAIMLHVADCHASTGLYPPPGSAERAQTYRWMSFLATNVYEGFLRLFYADLYTTGEKLSEVEESAMQYLDAMFDILNQALGSGFGLVADRIGITDIYLAMLLTWHPHQSTLYDRFENLQSCLQHVLKLDRVHAVFAENELI